jgi:ABC-type glycerol-3-phosphate transport system substrate-binding protein
MVLFLIIITQCSHESNSKPFKEIITKIDWENNIVERLTAEEWEPPKGWEVVKEHVEELTWMNPGSLEFDAATVENHRIFEAKTGIRIRSVVVSDGAQHGRQVALLSGKSNAIDVIHVFPKSTSDFYKNGWLQNVDYLWTEDAKKLYAPEAIKLGSRNETMYTVPVFGRLAVLIYRKDLFRTYLGHENPPQTWQEIIDFGRVLTLDPDNDGNIDTWGFVYFVGSNDNRNAINQLHSLLFSQGVDPTGIIDSDSLPNYTTPESKRSLQFLTDLVQTHKISPTGVVTYSDTETYRLFKTGKAAMILNHSWVNFKLPEDFSQDEYGMAFLPKCGGWGGGPQGKVVPRLEVQFAAINSFADPYKKVAGSLFLDFIRSFQAHKNEQIIEQNQVFMLSVYEDKQVKAKTVDFKLIIQGAEKGRDVVYYKNYGVGEILTRYISQAIIGEASPEEALNQAQKEINTLLRKH